MREEGRLLDVNLLLALLLTTHQHHAAAHRYLASLDQPWKTCPVTESAVIRLLVNPVVAGVAGAAALAAVRGLAADPRWGFVADDCTLREPTIDLGVLGGHQQVTDLQLVNLAATHGLVLATFDARMLGWLAPPDRRHIEVVAV